MSPPNATRISTDEAARRLGVSRDTIDRMIAEAPADLAGGPVDIGSLTSKKHRWLWDADRLPEWWDAYGRWRATRRTSSMVVRPATRRPRTTNARPQNAEAPRGKLTFAEINPPRGGR